jgi:hypothetical protein
MTALQNACTQASLLFHENIPSREQPVEMVVKVTRSPDHAEEKHLMGK